MFVIPEHYALIAQQQVHDIFFSLYTDTGDSHARAVERLKLFSFDGNLFSQL